ncbi:unnamed protein product [Vitrella brassicaformis CCMP3155]|uniref:Uncharacterized protein n=1 Tax=Vitrella brassicaformis (strain CCMP3155) TaxID=1169540 RepID=A0A0G4GRA4_VITBC|nr:unnamed protein product [Vitrella brassicaformis CCMP3155]|eukprot:CEM33055.1 unnamed protein product [Vitrella brassicaformis CCMP3155]
MAAVVLQAAPAYRRHIVTYALEANHPWRPEHMDRVLPHEVSTAYGTRLFTRLIERLQDPQFPTDRCVEALQTIACRLANQEAKCQAINDGLVPVVIALLAHESSEWKHPPSVHEEAAVVLGKLCLLRDGRQQVAEGGGIHLLTDLLLGSPKASVRECVGVAFFNLASGRDGCQYLIQDTDSFSLAAFLTSALPFANPANPPQTKEELCQWRCIHATVQALEKVTNWYCDGVRCGEGTGLIPAMCGFLERSYKHVQKLTPEERTAQLADSPHPFLALCENLLAAILVVLSHLALQPDGRKELIELKAVKSISTFLTHPNPSIRLACLDALSSISLDVQGKHLVLEDPRVQQCGVPLLLDEDERIKQKADQVVQSSSELPANRRQYVARLLYDFTGMQKLYGTSVIVTLVEYLRETVGLATNAIPSETSHATQRSEEALQLMGGEAHERQLQILKALLHFLSQDTITHDGITLALEKTPAAWSVKHAMGIGEALFWLLRDDVAEDVRRYAVECLGVLAKDKQARESLIATHHTLKSPELTAALLAAALPSELHQALVEDKTQTTQDTDQPAAKRRETAPAPVSLAAPLAKGVRDEGGRQQLPRKTLEVSGFLSESNYWKTVVLKS